MKAKNKKACYTECSSNQRFEPFSYDFSQFNINDFDTSFGADGEVIPGTNSVSIDSVPFTTNIPVGNDHPRWLGFLKRKFILPEKGEIIFKQKIAGQQFFPPVDSIPPLMTSRIRNINEDIRLASYAMNLLDIPTSMIFDFICSNEIIYAFYERLPFSRTPGNKYASFSNAIPVARRAKGLQETNILEIGIDANKGIVNWYVDGLKVFTVDKIGYRLNDEPRLLDLGGTEEIVKMTQISFGFGTFSLLDMALPNNYAREYVTQVGNETQIMSSALIQLETTGTYAELYQGLAGVERPLADPSVTFAYLLGQTLPNGDNPKLFGQGAALTIYEMEVFEKCAKS